MATTRPTTATGSVEAATGHALRRLARRFQHLTGEVTNHDEDLRDMAGQAVPEMFATQGYGVITTATLLITAGSNPEWLGSEASFAALCGTSPIPASSGKTHRYRLNRGGDGRRNGFTSDCSGACPTTRAHRTRPHGCVRPERRRRTSYGVSITRSPVEHSIWSSARSRYRQLMPSGSLDINAVPPSSKLM